MKPVLYLLALCTLLCGQVLTIGATQSVEVLRDPWGTPHVFAESEADGFFGLGCAVAEDRLLQMELIRRKVAGRLAEVFGPEWVDADREVRIAGHATYAPRAFARLPERWQVALRSYAAGVNAWRETNPEAVARRFQPLGIQPEPWTPADCLLAARGILSLGSPFNAGPVEEYHRFRELVAQVRETEAARRSGMVIDDSAAIVSEADMAKDSEVFQRLKRRPRMPGFDLRPAGGGEEPRKMSHAWAVSGGKSTTGKPILESDPQLPLSSPPFFHEFHLAAGRIDARGLGIPGCPGLFIGWNHRIAWGASALGTDSHVVFLDRLTSDGKGYVFEDKTVPFERRLERIEVKDGQPVIQEVLTSRHGTVFNSLVRASRAGEAYLCYDAQTMEDGASARMMLEAMDAGNWTDFRRALQHYYSPGLHIVYADAEGNVGYHTLVHRPLTARSPRRALEGWTGRDEVRDRIPFDELPHLFNPESGFVSHANNLPVGAWYPYDLGLATGGTGDTSRSVRLRQLLDGDRKFSVEDFERVLHRDDVNPLVAALLPVARKVVEEDKVTDAAVLGLLDAVKGWDLHDGTTDRFPAARGLRNTLTPYRGAGLQNVYGAGGGGISHLTREVGARFARDSSTPTNALVRAYLVNWLRASATGAGGARGGASNELTARMSQGRPAAAQDAGRTITIPYQRTIPHNLPVVDAALDLVSPPLTCLDQGTIWSQPGNLYSQIVDLADVDNSRSMMAPGNAEDGRFRTNQVDLWVNGATHPAPLSRTKLETLGVTRTKWDAKTYDGPQASRQRTVTETDRAARYVPAIPSVAATTNTQARPLPGRKPDDPTLEAAFRIILRQGTPPEEADAKLAQCRGYVKGNTGLTEQLRGAAVLGVYLIEESAAGRLKVRYGSPHVLEGLKTLLKDLGESEALNRGQPRGTLPERRPQPSSPKASGQPEVWLCAGERITDLLRPEAEWPFVKQHLSGLKLYVDQINKAAPEQLAALVRLVKEHRYQIAVELGGCLDFAPMDDTAGEWSARHELAKIDKFYAAGGQVDFLDLDGPIRRLMHPENRRDRQRLDSIEKAADELVDALRLHQQAHPKTKFWLLSNFPNWGYQGDVSYHARGPQRQDYGDDDEAVRVVLRKLRAAEIPLAGVTVDNPYDYLMGEHASVNLKDPKSVDWLGRVRKYEDFAREQGLEFNLIVNSERGGHESDELFHRETLQMVDTYWKAGGRPTRWFVQSWYPYPKRMVPETAPHTMTALVKAVIEQVSSSPAAQSRTELPARSREVVSRFRVIENVAYGKETPEAQVLSAFLVNSPPPSPVLVQIISGGWNSSPPRGTNLQPFQAYLNAGISVVMVAHRPVDDAVHWPAPADDVARAIQCIRAHAEEWGIDPKRIALKGRSSGGHVALMVGFGPDRAKPKSDDAIERQSSRPSCILAGSAPTDLAQQMGELLKTLDRQNYLWERMRSLLGAGREELTIEELTRRLKPLSPIEIVTKDAPPVLLMHPGPADAFWPGDARLKWDVHTPITGLILAKKLDELGVPHELVILPEDQGRRDGGTASERELAFLRRHLGLSVDSQAAPDRSRAAGGRRDISECASAGDRSARSDRAAASAWRHLWR